MTQAPDVAAICERLREQGVDVVRVSYPDMIGVDRGRDVLLDELPTAVGHGLAFCRRSPTPPRWPTWCRSRAAWRWACRTSPSTPT